MRTSLLLLAGLVAAPSVAAAQETIDIGVIRNDDITVVQKMLYPKQERWELGFHVGMMPFDAYLFTPNGQISFNHHFTDTLSLSVVAGGGYGLKNATFKELESPAYGAAPYAYRYLGSVLAGVEWAPVYAKMNLNGARVVHYDVYLAGRAGVSNEQSVIPLDEGGISVGPTLSPGIGARLWLAERSALRIELRDDLQIQRRSVTASTHLKQNANISLGFSILSPPKGRR
jgi:outer membrane beta-barrel protein